MFKKRGFFWRFLPLTALLLGAQVQALSIQYEFEDLTNTSGGQDLWSYSYHVGGSFAAGTGFNVLFDSALYDGLELEDSPPAPNADDWMRSTSQPVSSLPADGLYTVIAA